MQRVAILRDPLFMKHSNGPWHPESPDRLRAIGQMLAAFARECVAAGATGVFLSVRDDWVDRPANGEGTYDEIAMPADMEILKAVADAPFNVLHVCGRPLDLRR